jgi:hypothetical protein
MINFKNYSLVIFLLLNLIHRLNLQSLYDKYYPQFQHKVKLNHREMYHREVLQQCHRT